MIVYLLTRSLIHMCLLMWRSNFEGRPLGFASYDYFMLVVTKIKITHSKRFLTPESWTALFFYVEPKSKLGKIYILSLWFKVFNCGNLVRKRPKIAFVKTIFGVSWKTMHVTRWKFTLRKNSAILDIKHAILSYGWRSLNTVLQERPLYIRWKNKFRYAHSEVVI